jgi:hypothetical protein
MKRVFVGVILMVTMLGMAFGSSQKDATGGALSP